MWSIYDTIVSIEHRFVLICSAPQVQENCALCYYLVQILFNNFGTSTTQLLHQPPFCACMIGPTGPRTSSAVLDKAPTTKLLHQPPFLVSSASQVQEHRALCYSSMADGFRALLASGPEADFARLMQHLTQEFSECSLAVRTFEAVLREEQQYGRPDLAALLATLQDSERDKLRFTLSLQVR